VRQTTTITQGRKTHDECPLWLANIVKDQKCDDSANVPNCDYDGGDCCGTVDISYCDDCSCKDPRNSQLRGIQLHNNTLGLLGSWAPGLLGSWAPGILRLLGSWGLGLLGSWALELLGSWLLVSWGLGFLGSWAPGLLISWGLGFLGSWAPGILALGLLRSWTSGLLAP
jgi:hypothetical protein